MRKFLFLLLFSSAAMVAFPQQTQIRIEEYKMPGEGAVEKSVVVEMPYGKYDIQRISGDTVALRRAGDMIIDIVCTDYPSASPLIALNQNRLKQVLNRFPWINEKNIRQVNYLRQVNGSEKEKALSLFHGAVIRFRPQQTVETMKKDLEKLEELLAPTAQKVNSPKSHEPGIKYGTETMDSRELSGIETSTSPVSKSSSAIVDRYSVSGVPVPVLKGMGWYRITSEVEKDVQKRERGLKKGDSILVISPSEAFKKGILGKEEYMDYKQYPEISIYLRPVLTPGRFDIASIDSLAVVKDSLSATGYSPNPNYQWPDSTIFRVFARNEWRNVVVVGDVTGSMYPYTAQLLIWLKLHSLDSFTTQFAFFNDGDDTPDSEKRIGSTGGIYSKRCYTFEQAKNLVKSTMLKGGGGDCPENNIEALLQAERDFPDNKFQVLIADNWAPIKDKILMGRLTKPVRVVLCGANGYNINVDYLNLARRTKGSVHLIEEDLDQLAAMHEGETIRIGRLRFKIVDGEFKEVADSGLNKTL